MLTFPRNILRDPRDMLSALSVPLAPAKWTHKTDHHADRAERAPSERRGNRSIVRVSHTSVSRAETSRKSEGGRGQKDVRPEVSGKGPLCKRRGPAVHTGGPGTAPTHVRHPEDWVERIKKKRIFFNSKNSIVYIRIGFSFYSKACVCLHGVFTSHG